MKRPTEFIRNNELTVYLVCLASLLAFAYGFAASHYRIFPYDTIAGGIAAAKDWRANYKHYLQVTPNKFLHWARSPGEGVTRIDKTAAVKGLTFLTGFWEDSLGMRLIALDGEVVHRWDISYNEIWPNAEHLDGQPADWDTLIHGSIVYPNGDVVFNFENMGTVKIDACSNVIWQLARGTHHSIYEDHTGNYWIPEGVYRETNSAAYPYLVAPYWDERILEVSPEGEVLREISLLDSIYGSQYETLILHSQTVADSTATAVENLTADITHMNDIEVLSPTLAGAFPQFDAGDIMVSLRNPSTLLVLDGDSALIKWSMVGPFLVQHDPDFLPDGKILVFDNRAANGAEGPLKFSRILAIDPLSRSIETRFGGTDSEPFFTDKMGKQQPLANGGLLIAEPMGGRAFEVDRNGTVVWEFINRWSESKVALVGEATRLPPDFWHPPPQTCN
jgi:hypothetical protein